MRIDFFAIFACYFTGVILFDFLLYPNNPTE